MNNTITVTAYTSLKSFLKLMDIEYTESNGLFKIIPKDERELNTMKKYFATRNIKYEAEMIKL